MKGFEIYALIICLFVYVLFIALFSVFICMLTRSQIKLMEAGLEDEQIKKEHYKELNKKSNDGIIFKIIPILFCVILSALFAFSSYSALTQNEKVGKVPTLKVVTSGSMSMKFQDNEYLFENDLNNQIHTFDLIVLHELPKEQDLKLYDIVVYEVGENLLVHRIVGIEEPSAEHPNERYFLLQGDNVQYPDKFPVRYSQMKSIYKSERIPFVGSFVFFMQSPAGVLCFLLTIFGIIAIHFVEKKILSVRNKRLSVILAAEGYTARAETAAALSSEADTAAALSCEADTAENDEEQEIGYYANAKRLTFDEKVERLSAERRLWLECVMQVALSVPSVTERRSKSCVTYKIKSTPVLKICASRGYVSVYLAVDPAEYEDKRPLAAKDASALKAYALYPTKIKLTSQRKVKCVERILAERFGAQRSIDFNSDLYGRKRRSFRSKLASLPKERKDWYKDIVSTLSAKERISQRIGKNAITFRRGRTPIAKITVSRKMLRVYLNIDQARYSASKFGIKDVSQVKAHGAYPAMIKVTSQRRVSYIKQIINEL